MAPEPESALAVSVRHLDAREEYDRCCVLEEAVWGGEERDLVPASIFAVVKETGGQVFGAFLGDEMVGFTLGMAGFHDAGATGGSHAPLPYIHSHMTAVLPEHRDKGVGRMLKLFQRQDALSRGIRLVEWTFDPLEMRNAHFNLMKLGAVVRKFLPNFYGITTSHLHAGMPTDRLVAEWWIESPHTKRIILEAGPGAPLSAQAIRILVPQEMAQWRKTEAARALAEQTRIREEFLEALDKGYVATAIEQTPQGGQYVLEPHAEVKDDLACA